MHPKPCMETSRLLSRPSVRVEIVMPSFLLRLSREPGRGDSAVGLDDDLADLLPVETPVEADADPAPMPDVRRPEVALPCRDQRLLCTGRRRAPKMRELVVVMPLCPQHE